MQYKKLNYKAKLSSVFVVITSVVYLIILYICYAIFFNPSLVKIKNFNLSSDMSDNYVLAVFLVVVFALLFLLRPRYYQISDDIIIIKRYIFSIKIPINEITEIDVQDYRSLKIWLRLFGSGGVWGYLGRLYSRTHGVVRAQLSNTDDVVLFITKNNRKYLISPENPQDFVTAVNSTKQNLSV